jgi:hypothetical protein
MFRRLIRARQYAWCSGDRFSYNRLRNKVNRLAKNLRANYYMINLFAAYVLKILSLGGEVLSDLQPLINSTASGDVQLFASQVNNMLCEVSRDLKPLSSNQPSDGNLNTSQHYSRYVINLFEVFHELTRIDVHKLPGPDDLPNWVLHEYAFAISEPLCHIYNYSLQNGVVPDIWKAASVVLIPKRQPPTSIYDDLRPISLTSTLSKILERLIGRRMLPSIIPKFDHRQYGALKGRSTNHALIDVIHVPPGVDQHQSARCPFIDFSKAFYHVDHETVLNKLSEWGTDVIFLRWMRSYLYNRRQRVKIGNAVSTWSRPNGGMPQGSFFRAIHVSDTYQ